MAVKTNESQIRTRMGAVRAGRESERGQSMIEFLLLLPMLLGVTLILFKVNMAIQMSIVNQQYARAQAHWLTFNSSIYPERRLRRDHFVPKAFNQMVLGVSDNIAPDVGEFNPEASTQLVARNRRLAGGDGDAQAEPESRGLVRIRNTITLCTQSNVFDAGGNNKPDIAMISERGLTSAAFMYCRGPLDE